ncbi:MAG: hypothetical protein ACXVO1_07505 [Tumebacillaceae bacterium]
MAKLRRRRAVYKALRFQSRQFKPYATAIGQLVLAWNDLHEVLVVLFWTLRNFDDKIFNEWDAAKFDHKKRTLISKWISGLPAKTKALAPELYTDLEWLIKEIDRLAEPRNDGAHTPLTIIQDTPFLHPSRFTVGVAPNITWGNSRAKQLFGKDLLADFRKCRNCASKLADFARTMERALADEHTRWPARPLLKGK